MTGLSGRVSVVLLVRNQSWNVDRLISSVLADPEIAASPDVYVVDSASIDDTVEVASRRRQVTVIELAADQRLNAATGRQVGYENSERDYVLFLDGDMELCVGFLGQAKRTLDEHPDVAIVGGEVVDLPPESASPGRPPGPTDATVNLATYSAGGGLHRRAALDASGTYDRNLYSEEEPELALRLRTAGSKIVTLARPMAYHYSAPRHGISTLLARRRRNLYLGGGQILRKHRLNEVGRLYLRERAFGLPILGVIAVSIAGTALDVALGRRRRGRVVAALIAPGYVVATAVRMRTPYKTVHSLLQRVLWAEGTVRGLALKPLEESKAPVITRVRVAGSV